VLDSHAGTRQPRHGKYTIGYLDDNDCNEFFTQVLEGISDAARRFEVNLVRFGYFTEDEPERHAQLLALMQQADLDGLVFLGWTQAAVMYNREDFLTRFSGLPLVSAGALFADIPSVLCDGSDHIRHIVRHLIRRHGYRRIAYLPPERPDNRLEAWEEVLRENGLWYPELHIEDGEWKCAGHAARARRFFEILLDEREIPLDAVVSSGEYETESLMRELARRHLRVPEDIALTGYVDGDFERYSQPGITTVDYPWAEIGYQAMRVMLDLLTDGSAPAVTVVPGRVLYRGSCGCVSDVVHLFAVGPAVPSVRLLTEMTDMEHAELVAGLCADFHSPGLDFHRLVDTFLMDCRTTEPGAFLPEFSRQVAETSANLRQARLETLVARFRNAVMPWLIASPELMRISGELFRQAQLLLTDAIRRSRGHAEIQSKNLAQSMQETSQAVMTEHSNPAIFTALMENLLKIDVGFCCVVLQETRLPESQALPTPSENRFERGETVFIDVLKREMISVRNLPAKALFRRLMPESGHARFLQVHPLMAAGTWMGYVLFEPGPTDELVYRTLATHLAAGFISAMMAQRLEENYHSLVERAFEEGMADVVSQVLHNIGNVYNSVNASVQLLTGELAQSPVPDLLQAGKILRGISDGGEPETESDIERRLKLMNLFRLLGRNAEKHRETLLAHFGRISRNVHLMDDSITIQQGYASGGGLPEPASLLHMVEDAIRVHEAVFGRMGITVVKGWHAAPLITVQRSRMFQVLVFLLGALGETLHKAENNSAQLWISMDVRTGCSFLRLWGFGKDLREYLAGVDAVGFESSSGNRMHTLEACYAYVREMGGELTVAVGEGGKSTSCELVFPVSAPDAGGTT